MYSIYFLSEKALVLEFGEHIADEVFTAIQQFQHLLKTHPFEGLEAIVPAYTSISIFFDPYRVMASSQLKGIDCQERLRNYLADIRAMESPMMQEQGNTIIIPVCYGGKMGPDLALVAQHGGVSEEEVIQLHTAMTYKVYMMGFLPGFAYLGGLDPRLASPRKAQPRAVVPAGSVGIAGQQTGIYPMNSPGGWQIIGQSPLKMFDMHRPQASLLKAGDLLQFKAIDLSEYHYLKHSYENQNP